MSYIFKAEITCEETSKQQSFSTRIEDFDRLVTVVANIAPFSVYWDFVRNSPLKPKQTIDNKHTITVK